MPNKCSAPGCNGNYDDNNKVHIFSFPQEQDLRTAWMKAIPRKDFIYTKYARVSFSYFIYC